MKKFKVILPAGVAAGALLAAMSAASDANAGSFGIREQSATFQGMSFAGSAAGHQLSSMFWNSAAAAAVDGFNTESHASLVIPDASYEANGGVFTGDTITGTGTALDGLSGAALDRNSGDIGEPAVVPAAYMNYQLSDRLYLGLATNSPYAFTTKPENDDWAGSPIAETSEIFSININPTLAYKVTPEFTVGVGVQAQYTKAHLSRDSYTLNNSLLGPIPPGFQVPLVGERDFQGDDIAFGATAGVLWQPRPGTTLGLGYRSALDLELEGSYERDPQLNTGTGVVEGAFDENVTVGVTLPELVTFSLRQDINERLAVLGTVEWTNWSRLGTLKAQDDGDTVEALSFDYDDGWFYSAGLEYKYSPTLTLRTGLAYEESPISDETRNVTLPDNERVWLSFGATQQISERITIDVAYTHIFVEDGPVCEDEEDGCAILDADAESEADIVSAALKYKIGGARQELEPLK